MSHRIFSCAVAACLSAPAAGVHAQAQFPTRPVTIIVAETAGGPGDSITRAVAQKLQAMWGQPVVVENRPGASGAIGAQAVLNTPADGYTYLKTFTSFIQSVGLNAKLNFDPLKDFAPVTQLSVVPLVLVVREPDGPRSMAELVARAKADPKSVAYGSFGLTSTAHIYGEQLNRVAGIKAANIPYTGGPAAVTALLGGHITASFQEASNARLHMDSGKVRALAVTGAQRAPQMPDVPTFAELGYAGFDVLGWHGVLAPRGVPKEIAAKVAADIGQALRDPAISKRFNDLGQRTVGSTPDEWGAVLRSDTEKWKTLIRDAGIKTD